MQEFSTPMMKQYMDIKSKYPDCLLFFRLGDFYELFLEDAKIGADVLDITLTRRSRGKDGDIPMCGVPYHALDSYIYRLVKAGYKVAICEQVSEPGKELVEREVVRIVTPGTILDEKSLESKENNYLVSLEIKGNLLGIATADISTGAFYAKQVYADDLEQTLFNELSRINPSECILSDHLYNQPHFLKALKKHKNINIFRFDDWGAYSQNAEKHLKSHFNVQSLNGFGLEDKPYAAKAASVLLGYLKHTQKEKIDHIKTINSVDDKLSVGLDRSTIINLELFSTIRDGEKRGSLINLIDKTYTAMGGRLLRQWVLKPLTNKNEITKRYEAVETLLKNSSLRSSIVDELSEVTDFERLFSKLSVGIGNARDLVNLKETLKKVIKVKELTTNSQANLIKKTSSEISKDLNDVVSLIEKNILDEPAIDTKNGNLIKRGVSDELDQLKDKISGSTSFLNELEAKERKRTGISSLKVKYNMVFGYYIEVTKANLHMVPEDYFRKQTLVNAERFFTKELKEHEEIVLTAQEKINDLEYQIFTKTVEDTMKYTLQIQKAAESIAIIDCLISFTELAEKENYCKPEIIETGEIEIKDGRHAVVEKLLETGSFVPNDTFLDQNEHQLLILTGPNMAGKSVYIRQIALIVLMAQMGSFVPAKSARISLVDKIFVRSGASDVITSGLSTFMVEMVETAYILNNATDKSLIVMDEIGRGTSTFDGISIAWSVAEYLVNNQKAKPKTLFATHYHELQKLEEKFPNKIKNYQVLVEEGKENPVFLHRVARGGADHSYGIAVAKMSGVPREVVQKAYEVLIGLENGKGNGGTRKVRENSKGKVERVVASKLNDIDINGITPIQALEILNEIKLLLQQPK